MVEISDYEYRELQYKAKKLDEDKAGKSFIFRIIILALIVVALLITLSLAGCPTYNVWKAEMKGKAELSEAEYSKQVQIEEAKANLEAEDLNAQAEVIRAQGVADAIDIEGGKITDSYIKYLWVKNLSLSQSQIIYIPTESGGLPALTQDITSPNPDELMEEE